MGWNEIRAELPSVQSAVKAFKSETESSIIGLLDLVLKNNKVETAFKTFMLTANTPIVYRNNHGVGDSNIVNASALINMIRPSSEFPKTINMAARALRDWDKILAEPNLGGIPITITNISTERQVEVSESQVIIQSSSSRQYWADNAVPKLKVWELEGYLTSSDTTLDRGFVIKPTLTYQAYYLDMVASSRRPVLFKTSRGEFVKVQITNLRFDEESTYNNAIKISCSLKEYKPYTISDVQDNVAQAIWSS